MFLSTQDNRYKNINEFKIYLLLDYLVLFYYYYSFNIFFIGRSKILTPRFSSNYSDDFEQTSNLGEYLQIHYIPTITDFIS